MPSITVQGSQVFFDECDAETVLTRRWRLDSHGYPICGKRGMMHRLLMNAPAGVPVDHRDGNPLNNRRSNLRLATLSINAQNLRAPTSANTTGYLGVDYLPKKCPKKPYRAQIRFQGKKVHVGLFSTAEAAFAAYVEAKRRLHPGCTL